MEKENPHVAENSLEARSILLSSDRITAGSVAKIGIRKQLSRPEIAEGEQVEINPSGRMKAVILSGRGPWGAWEVALNRHASFYCGTHMFKIAKFNHVYMTQKLRGMNYLRLTLIYFP